MARNGFEKNKSNIKKTQGRVPQKRKRRRSMRLRAVAIVTVLVVLIVGLALTFTVFFKVKSIDVYGESRYSTQQVIKAANISLDSNLIRLDSELISARIEKALPYIAEAKIKKRLPTTVDIVVTEAQVAGYIEADNGSFLMSVDGKILEEIKEPSNKLCKIHGIKVKEAKISEKIVTEGDELRYINDIFSALGRGISSEITSVDVSDKINLSVVYADRVEIKFGSEAELSKKARFVTQILLNPEEVNQDDMGVIYASNPKKISFLRKGSYKEYLFELEKEQNTSSSLSITETESEFGTSSKKAN